MVIAFLDIDKGYSTMELIIYDTTLRDGAQGQGISFSCNDKLKVASRLDEFGIQYIEGGWPGSNPKDIEFFERAKYELQLKQAKLVAFGSTCRVGLKPADDPQVQQLLTANTSVITIFGKSWDFHVAEVLHTTLEENLRMICDTVLYLKSHDKEVIFDAEHFFDGYRSNAEYALLTLQLAVASGATTIVLCDTNGGSLPWQIGQAVDTVMNTLYKSSESNFVLGIHAHNDSETAVANSLEAVHRGCTHIQGTINGYGERCGNANLISVIPNLQLKMGYSLLTAEQLTQLTNLSRYVGELTNLLPNTYQPFVGHSAFAHKAGTHVNAIEKHPLSYQHIDPITVGNEPNILISELSGKSSIALKLFQLGLERLGLEEERRALGAIKENEHKGFTYESAEASVALILQRAKLSYAPLFELIDYAVSVKHQDRRGIYSEATVKISIDHKLYHEVAEGNGPINALDLALRKALQHTYSYLRHTSLADFKVRILDGKDASGATVRVLIDSTDGSRIWSTVGAHTNLVEASWIALVDAMEYFILVNEMNPYTNIAV